MTKFFSARLNRLGFVIGLLIVFLLQIFFNVFSIYIIPLPYHPWNLFIQLILIFLIIRRLHDMGYGFLTCFIVTFLASLPYLYSLIVYLTLNYSLGTINYGDYIELISNSSATMTTIIFIILLILKGQDYDNKYGTKPIPGLLNALKQLFNPEKTQTPESNTTISKHP